MKFRNSVFTFLLAVAFQSAFAAEDSPYLPVDSVPNAIAFLPPPPDTNSTQFVADISQYMWGKSMRNDSARAALAKTQAAHKSEDVLKLFSEPFGYELSESKTPAIFKLVNRSIKTVYLSGRAVKKHYMRKRPFDRFKEPTLVPSDEEALKSNGSYPSGHTIIAYTTALVLIEINPAAQNDLMKYAYDWGQSRVISGFHWQSDVDASKVIVASGFARLQRNKEFQADLQKALAEFAKLQKASRK